MALMLSRRCISWKSQPPEPASEMIEARQHVVRLARLLIVLVFGIVFAAAVVSSDTAAAEDRSPDAALSQLLDDTRAEIPGACSTAGKDSLVRVLCDKRIRIGVRSNYPKFAALEGETW